MPPDISKMNVAELFQHVWNTEYVPRWNDAFKHEAEQRSDAFCPDSITITVCGEELRMLTMRDLFTLETLENRFIVSGRPELGDCLQLLWHLNTENNGRRTIANTFRRGRMTQRVGNRHELADTVAEILGYMDRMMLHEETEEMFLTDDQKKEKAQQPKPTDTHYISSYLITVAAEIGPVDPWSGRLLADMPLPRLMQYSRDIARKKRKPEEEHAEMIDSLRVRCMDDVNAITAKLRAEAAAKKALETQV